MSASEPIVYVVDDDPSFRRSTERLIRSAGYKVQSFGTAAEFLSANAAQTPGCVVLDVRLPGLSGLDLQRELAKTGNHLPIIFMTGHGDIPMSVRAIKTGAVEFLPKPFRDEDLLEALRQALERDRAAREQQARCAAIRERYDSLTAREHEVMALVVAGLLNKQIAGELGTVEKTIKFHRAHIMQKMGAESVATLVRMAEQLKR